MNLTNELQLWVTFQQGNVEAYAELYTIYASQLYSYGTKFSEDTTLVEDAIQDLFCTLWTSRERLSQPTSTKNYLFKSLRTSLFKKLSKKLLALDEDTVLQFHFEIGVDEKLSRAEQLNEIKLEVEKALDKLTSRQREIIYYRFYMNLGFDEIADIMGMQVRATYKLTARALDSMRELMPAGKFFSFLFFFQVQNQALKNIF